MALTQMHITNFIEFFIEQHKSSDNPLFTLEQLAADWENTSTNSQTVFPEKNVFEMVPFDLSELHGQLNYDLQDFVSYCRLRLVRRDEPTLLQLIVEWCEQQHESVT